MNNHERRKALAAERPTPALPRKRWLVLLTVLLLLWCCAAHCQRIRAALGPVPETKQDAGEGRGR